jgi:hypothetical protein
VDGPGQNSQAIAGADFMRLAIDPPRQRPHQTVDNLVDLTMIMGHGDALGWTVISKITSWPESCVSSTRKRSSNPPIPMMSATALCMTALST